MSADFINSTHRKNWLISDSVLCNIHEKDLKSLTEHEIQVLYINECEVIVALAKKLQVRQVVVATAQVYFRRFYVHWCFSDFDPRLVAPTCLWLATKVEESAVGDAKHIVKALMSIEDHDFCEQDLLSCELFVLEALNFDLIVYHSYLLLNSIAKSVKLTTVDTLWSIVNDSYFTDVSLRYAPHIVALGCVHVVAHIRELDVSDWFIQLQVNHVDVWDVSRKVLDLYQTWKIIHGSSKKPTSKSILEKLKPKYQL